MAVTSLNSLHGMFGSSLLLSVALVLLLGAPAHTTQQYSAEEALFKNVCDALTCQCGCHKMLSICEMQRCHSATPMRAEIKEKLAEGEGKEAILAGFVDRYGLVVLSAPPTSGFHLTAWIMPFVVLMAGAWVAKSVLGSWKRQTVETASESPDKKMSEITAEQQARIDRELQDF